MRREREAMGLPPLPKSAPSGAVGSSSAAVTVTETTVTDERGAGVPEKSGFREGAAAGEEDELMWLIWPYQVRFRMERSSGWREGSFLLPVGVYSGFRVAALCDLKPGLCVCLFTYLLHQFSEKVSNKRACALQQAVQKIQPRDPFFFSLLFSSRICRFSSTTGPHAEPVVRSRVRRVPRLGSEPRK